MKIWRAKTSPGRAKFLPELANMVPPVRRLVCLSACLSGMPASCLGDSPHLHAAFNVARIHVAQWCLVQVLWAERHALAWKAAAGQRRWETGTCFRKRRPGDVCTLCMCNSSTKKRHDPCNPATEQEPTLKLVHARAWRSTHKSLTHNASARRHCFVVWALFQHSLTPP